MSWDDSSAKLKRFYKTAAATAVEGGWTVTLDDRPLRTPARAPFIAPEAAARMAAAEWAAQEEVVDPHAMPTTRTINSAIDRVAPQREAVIDDIAAYGGSDLLCYRADAPAALVERQQAAWDPLLDWAAESLGARLFVVDGVIFAAQSPDALAALRAGVAAESDLGVAALHELTTLSGSLVLALAVDHGRIDAETAWSASRIDEDFQIEQWGSDAEAAAAAARRRDDFAAAARLITAAKA